MTIQILSTQILRMASNSSHVQVTMLTSEKSSKPVKLAEKQYTLSCILVLDLQNNFAGSSKSDISNIEGTYRGQVSHHKKRSQCRIKEKRNAFAVT